VERLSKKHSKPVAMDFVADLETIAQTQKAKGYPIFDTIEDAVWALATQWKHRNALNRTRDAYMNLEQPRKNAGKILSLHSDRTDCSHDRLAFELVKAYGIPCEMPMIAANLEQARETAKALGYPVVMKINSPDIPHKTDAGGVKTNIANEAELTLAFREIIQCCEYHAKGARIYGVSLQKMISGGLELIIGGKYDRDFGPVIMFGMGGIFVEVLKDVTFRMAPLGRGEAREMIKQSMGSVLLKGLRGEKPYDITALTDALERFSILLADYPQIAELDLNPVKIFHEGEGLIAVDARIKID
jgi:acyl-CoA synthetase (NDP forming)